MFSSNETFVAGLITLSNASLDCRINPLHLYELSLSSSIF